MIIHIKSKQIIFSALLLLSTYTHAQVYGRLKANIMSASNALNTFNNVNMGAATAATNTDAYTGETGDRSTFQVVQSRIGSKFKLNEKVKALIEVDFIDFSQTSPTTTVYPRLRRAMITHQVTDKLQLQMGQDWDLFSGLNPKNYNYIGNYFNAGNIGFMKNQFIGSYQLNSQDKLSFAISQAGNSSNPTETELENENRISLTGVFEKALKHGLVQLGIISATRDFQNKEEQIWGVSLGGQYKVGSLNITTEVYNGEGLNKLALLSLQNNNFAHEYGGYLNSQYQFLEESFFILGFGMAKQKILGPVLMIAPTLNFQT